MIFIHGWWCLFASADYLRKRCHGESSDFTASKRLQIKLKVKNAAFLVLW